MDDGKVISQPNRKVATQRAMVAGWRRTPEWKGMLRDHAHIPEAECAICHRKHGQLYERKDGKVIKIILTINHTDRRCYLLKELYLTWNPSLMRVECTTCNWMYEKGMVPCPECLKEGVVTYIRWDEGECYDHWAKKNPESVKKAQEERAQFKASVRQYNANRAAKDRQRRAEFPCRFRGSHQWCRVQNIACTFTKRSCRDCLKFQEKIKFLKGKK